MNNSFSTKSSITILFSIVVLGGGVLVWLAPVPDGQLTKAQDNLIEIADWMVKASIGAILGLIGGQRLAGGKSAVRNGS